MPVNTSDQQVTIPIGADVADNPVAFVNQVADIEPKLVRAYTNEADRAARMTSLPENSISTLAAENRAEIYTGTTQVSLYTRSLYAQAYKAATQILTQNSTALQNVTDLVIPVPAAGTFSFRGVIYYETGTAPDIKFAFLVPAGSVLRWGGLGVITGGTTTGDGTFVTTTPSDGSVSYGGAGIGTVLFCQIEGEYVAGGTAGNFQFRAAQNAADLSNTSIIARSRIEMWRHL